MRRYITIDAETRRQLIRKYNVGRRTIWEALSFITRNKRGDSIRRDALAMGGEYREEDFVPDCQTEFLEDGMHQRFATGVEVVCRTHSRLFNETQNTLFRCSSAGRAAD